MQVYFRLPESLSYRVRQLGLTSSGLVLCILMATVMLLGGAMIYRSIEAQHQLKVSFVGWYEGMAGYEKALVDQKKLHKPMLVYFYAPWCPYCKRFDSRILADKKMKAFVQGYPHVKIYPDDKEAELQLMKHYGAEGYPSFYVLMPNHKLRSIETSSRDGGPFRLKTPNEFMQAILKATEGA